MLDQLRKKKKDDMENKFIRFFSYFMIVGKQFISIVVCLLPKPQN